MAVTVADTVTVLVMVMATSSSYGYGYGYGYTTHWGGVTDLVFGAVNLWQFGHLLLGVALTLTPKP